AALLARSAAGKTWIGCGIRIGVFTTSTTSVAITLGSVSLSSIGIGVGRASRSLHSFQRDRHVVGNNSLLNGRAGGYLGDFAHKRRLREGVHHHLGLLSDFHFANIGFIHKHIYLEPVQVGNDDERRSGEARCESFALLGGQLQHRTGDWGANDRFV